MGAPVVVLTVLDRFTNTVLPVWLWDGSNQYCSQPGREGSEYANDLAALCEARAAVAELIDKVDSALALGWSDTAARELRAALARCTGEGA